MRRRSMEMGVVAGMAMTMRMGTRRGATVHMPRFGIELGIGFMRVSMHQAFGTTEQPPRARSERRPQCGL